MSSSMLSILCRTYCCFMIFNVSIRRIGSHETILSINGICGRRHTSYHFLALDQVARDLLVLTDKNLDWNLL